MKSLGAPASPPANVAAEINHLHRAVRGFVQAALAHGAQACKSAIQCGLKLIEARAAHPGEFLLWLGANCPDISERTAQNFMRVARRHAQALADGSLEFQTLKELYVATGLLPAPEPQAGAPATESVPAWLRFTERIDSQIPKLKPDEKEALRAWCRLLLQRL